MTDANRKRVNSALWWGLLFTVLGLLSNGLYFLGLPARLVVWLSLLVPAVGLVFLLIGLQRAFARSDRYRGKVLGSVLTALAVLLFVGAAFLFVHARALPRSAGAPQVGQRIPDFTLPDSNGQPISLSQLFSAPPGGAEPKAVLLIFYRGYW
jgi:O-antigen/teichoic acid export membrane protein